MQTNYRLCNVLLTDGTRSEEYPDLYVRRTTPIRTHKDGTASLADESYVKYDFATYFNAFSNRKWHTYARVNNVILHLEAKGRFDVTLVAYEQTMARPKRVELLSQSFECADFESVDLEFPDSDAVLLAFEILAYGKVDIREAYYYTQVDDVLIRPVELAVATTTFQKEDFVIPNIELFRSGVLGCDEPIAKHFTLHVIDNGRTLDVASLESDRICIHPNPNVGGAGGFTRGMIEAMEQEPRATHVLLMDDDVQVSPESLKRTYNLLSLVRDEYRESFVSGAMLSFERQDDFHEDIGFVRPSGTYGPVKQTGKEDANGPTSYNISKLEDVLELDALEPRRNNVYAGWWYCCIPLTVIEDKGLPLPIFIRGDDAEYGNRCCKKFIHMNGICIWHLTLAFKFRAALERYQVPRNSLIAQATTGVYGGVDFLVDYHVYVYLDLKTFNYDGVELSLKAMEDFLKGPEFIKHVNSADLNRLISAKNENPVPLEDIDDPLVQGLDFAPGSLYAEQRRSVVDRAYDLLTLNGQRGPKALARGGLGVVPFDGWYYPPNEIRGKDALLAVTADGRQGVLRKKDRARFTALLKRYKALMKEYAARKDEVNAEWAAAREELTSLEFWKWYLADQDK